MTGDIATRLESLRQRLSTPVIVSSLVLLTVVMTWPVAADLGGRFAGLGPDLRVALWDFAWVERVLLEGRAPLYTTDIFYPEGTSLSYHSISWLSGIWALPLRKLFGHVAGYNLYFLSQTFMCAVTMFVLVRRITERRDCAWLAALVFAFAPFRMVEAERHPNLAGTCFIPLVLLGFWNGMRDGRARWAWLAAGGVAATLLTGAHLFIMTTLAMGSYWMFEALSRALYRSRMFWRWSALVAGASLLCCALPLLQFLVDSGGFTSALEVRGTTGRYADALALVTPHDEHFLLGALGRGLSEMFGSRPTHRHYLGLLPLLLSIAALVLPAKRRAMLPVAATALLLLSLSMGDVLVFGGRHTSFVLPHALVANLSPIRALRYPDRFLLVFSVFFAVLAGCGAASLLPRKRPVASLLMVLLGLFVLSEQHMGPYRTSIQDPDPIYAQLPPDGLAILELPLTRTFAKSVMLQQSYHRRPVVNGMVARGTTRARSYIDASPLLGRLAAPELASYRCGEFDLRRQWRKLESDGVGYLVVGRKQVRDRRRALDTYLTAEPILENGRRSVFRIGDLAEGSPTCG